MNTQETPTMAFISSLIGGILITVAGILSLALFPFGTYGFGGMMGGFWRGMGGMMGRYGGIGGMMGGFWGYPQAVTSIGVSFGFVATLAIIGLVAGMITVIGSFMLNARPMEHTMWGVIILAFSIISFLGMGGFFIGAMMGIFGGALAIIWKPTVKA